MKKDDVNKSQVAQNQNSSVLFTILPIFLRICMENIKILEKSANLNLKLKKLMK